MNESGLNLKERDRKVSPGTLRVRCGICAVWDDKDQCVVTHWAYKTLWMPPVGIEPLMREFYCNNCKSMNYVLMSKVEEISG